jgi:hypothetical protein
MYGVSGSHRHYATHASILTPARSNTACRDAFSACRTLSYHKQTCVCLSQTSVGGLSPVTFSARWRSTSELLRTL